MVSKGRTGGWGDRKMGCARAGRQAGRQGTDEYNVEMMAVVGD